jgi:hypothetical protein
LDTLTPDPDGVPALLARKQIQTVTFEGWRRIDAVEMAAGEERGKPREKLTTRAQLLAATN